ncbi:MAG: transcription elongation factor GreA [Candidatus Berkelbacteria bacterium]
MPKETLLTQQGLEKLKKELKELKERRKTVAERIRIAREYGDLSENSEYDDARNEQSFVEGKIQDLEEMIKNAKVVVKSASSNKVEMGSTVTLKLDNDSFSYEIVGANESDPLKGKISAESPLGFSLIGKAKGEKVDIKTPGGTTTYLIVDVK